MVRSRAFGFLAIALCFVSCLCAHAEVSQDAAEEAVREVKQLTDKALRAARADYNDAKYLKENVESRKVKAEQAASEAEKAAEDNTEAIAIANEAKSALEELNSIYPSAQEKAQKAVDFTKDLLSKASELYGNSKIQISPDGGSGNEYSKVSASVAEVKNQTQELEEEIKKSKQFLNSARVEMFGVSQKAEKAQVAKHHVHAIVTVAKMKTLLSEADTDIASIQRKGEEITAIVQEIEEHLKTAPRDLTLAINRFHTKAHGDLGRVTSLINEVQEAKQAMLKEKTDADKTLEEIPALTGESEVRQKAGSVEYFSNNAAEKLNKIKTALEYTQSYAVNSNKQKQDTLQALASHNSKPGTEEDKETNKPSQPVDDATTKTTSEGTKEQKDTNPSEPLQNAITKTTSEGTKERKDTNPSQPLQDVTTKTMSEGKKETKGTNPGQYVEKSTKSPGIKGKVSPYGADDDSAITVSFSLLLALIACAALI